MNEQPNNGGCSKVLLSPSTPFVEALPTHEMYHRASKTSYD